MRVVIAATCFVLMFSTSIVSAQDGEDLVLTGPDTYYLGLPANFNITGAEPGETVKLYFSWTPDEEICPGFLFGACLSFGMPIPNVGNGVADDLGNASVSARVTAGVGLGETLLFQAVVMRGPDTVVSNLITGTPVYAECGADELWDFVSASCVSAGGGDADFEAGRAVGFSEGYDAGYLNGYLDVLEGSIGFSCGCEFGYEWVDGPLPACIAIDECEEVIDPCGNGVCIDGSFFGYSCECDAGFELTEGDFPTCVDIDECLLSFCHPDATCTNFEGGYDCVCNFGFEGDGYNFCDAVLSPDSQCTIYFDDAYEALGQGSDPEAFYGAAGVHFDNSSGYGVIGGEGNGDPGNWDIEGTNGSAAWGMWDSAHSIWFDAPVYELSIDFLRGFGDYSVTVDAYLDDVWVEAGTVSPTGEWGWDTLSIAGPIDELRWDTGCCYGADNLEFAIMAAMDVPWCEP
jgi:hypothetical protein